MRQPRAARPLKLPEGLLSLAAFLWAAALLTAGTWVLTSTGWGLLTLGILGGLALVGAELVIKDDTSGGSGR